MSTQTGHSRLLRWTRLLWVVVLVACQTLGSRPPRPRPVFYPLPPDPPRIQFLTAINFSWDVVSERTGLARFVFGPRPELERTDLLQRPYGIAIRERRIYVCDQGGGAVKVFDLENDRYFLLGGDLGIISEPTNLSISPDGYKFVVESMKQVIHAFGPDDAYLGSFKVKEGRPAAVAVVGSELFVPDITGDRILVLDRSTGRLQRALGGKGRGPGQFLMPNAIGADAEGNVYVSDQMNYRFQKLDRNGTPLLWTGTPGNTYGSFERPKGIAVGPDGVIYVVETVNEVVQMFDQQGRVLMAFGNFRASPGFLELPASVAVDRSTLEYFAPYVDPRFQAEYLIFVTSQVGDARIGVYAFGHLKPGYDVPGIPSARR